MDYDTMMEMGFPFTSEPESKKEIEYAEDPLTGTLEILPAE